MKRWDPDLDKESIDLPAGLAWWGFIIIVFVLGVIFGRMSP